MGLIDSPLRRRCGAEKQTLAHVLGECEALAKLRHTYLGPWEYQKSKSGGHLELH